RRAFEACGPRLSASLVYDWARRWQRRHDEKRINQRERYSIVRVLMTMAVRDGRAGTRGRPWLWRRIESHSRYFIYLKVAFERGEGEMAVYGYARVSTRDQDLAGQVAELQAAGCGNIFREKASGAKTDRPELAKLIRRLDAGDVLVVTRLDRLARSTRDLLN